MDGDCERADRSRRGVGHRPGGRATARPAGDRRGGDRHLRLGPGHQAAGLGRAPDRAVRVRRHDLRADHRGVHARVHPDDLPRVGDALETAIAECGEFDAVYRVVPPGGAPRWVSARGKALPGDDGTAIRLIGVAADVTAALDGEARVTRVLEAMPAASTRWTPRGGSPTSTPRRNGCWRAAGKSCWARSSGTPSPTRSTACSRTATGKRSPPDARSPSTRTTPPR
ncbi:hypothetical protein A7K94_0214075 [Modestobacter sp. VKM Ac-2676]|nr:hypothetical protein A7K94_0214075 [Modestobacter sp. VKM Ac-2676]